MSLETMRRAFFDTSKNNEQVTVVHVHGFGVDNTDVRQREIARHLPESRHVMPEMCDVINDDILHVLPIEEQARRLHDCIDGIPGPKVMAAHSQGTIAAAEVVNARPEEFVHTVWMGPVIDTARELPRLESEAERWAADIDVIQNVQDQLPEATDTIEHYIHYRPNDIAKPTTDVVLSRRYLQSLGAWAARHVNNLQQVFTALDATVILAGNETTTDGTFATLARRIPDVVAYDEIIDRGRIQVLDGANHRFGGGYRERIAHIMETRIPMLGRQLASTAVGAYFHPTLNDIL